MNSKSLHDAPVLMLVVNEDLIDIFKLLLEVGAEPNIPDRVISFMTIFVPAVSLFTLMLCGLPSHDHLHKPRFQKL